MQRQEATVKRKKKSTLWGLAGILFCLNVAVYYLLFVWPSNTPTVNQTKSNPSGSIASKTNANVVSEGRKK
jgi:hypothetical protein